MIINPGFQEKNKNLTIYVKELRVTIVRIEIEYSIFKSLKKKSWAKKTH